MQAIFVATPAVVRLTVGPVGVAIIHWQSSGFPNEITFLTCITCSDPEYCNNNHILNALLHQQNLNSSIVYKRDEMVLVGYS